VRVLVTGAAGFIGYNTCVAMANAGHRVAGIDAIYKPCSELKRWRAATLYNTYGISVSPIDIRDADAISSRLSEYNFDVVIHLAALAGVRSSITEPQRYLDVNIGGTLNMLDFCVQNGVGKFILASTSSVYGSVAHPTRELDPTDKLLSPYALSKRSAEGLASVYSTYYYLDVSILRYFTVYGPFGRPDMVILRFIHRISNGIPIEVYGDGQQWRDFTYIDDVVGATLAAMKPLGCGVMNVGSGSPVQLSRVIELISDLVGRKPIIEYGEAHPCDPQITSAHITLAGQLLGWKPSVSIEDGIRRTIDWYNGLPSDVQHIIGSEL